MISLNRKGTIEYKYKEKIDDSFVFRLKIL